MQEETVMGRLIEFLFTKIYISMLISGIFILLSLSGGLIFGMGPAGMTVMSLIEAYGDDYKSYGLREAWDLFKTNFRKGNQVFLSFLTLYLLLTYGIYLMVQLPQQSLLYIIVGLMDLIFLLVLPFVYALYLKIQVHFELSYQNSIKLAFITLFLAPASVIFKLILGTALVLAISWYAPALGFFVLIGMWHFFTNDALEPIYALLKERIHV